MYSLSDYSRMIADRVRLDAYTEALRRAVRSGSVVVDLGAGTGIMTLLACRFGAGRVFAIEPGEIIQVAREVVAANGFSDRVEFLQQLSTEVTLPARADVVVSDLRGVLPLYQQHLPAIADARRRFLAPGGTLIPRSDTLWAAPVEATDFYETFVAPGPTNGVDLEPARRRACNLFSKARVSPQQLLAEPFCWATLDYSVVESPDVAADLRFSVSRAGTAHGLLLWFDSVLADGAAFSNSPAAPELIYGSGFFPLAEPVPAAPGDTVAVALRADLVGEDYVWRWETSFSPAGDPARLRAGFRQSTFYASALSPGRLSRRAAGHEPVLNEEGEIDFFLLSQWQKGVTLEELARRLAARFPGRFPGLHEALTRAAELSLKYSR